MIQNILGRTLTDGTVQYNPGWLCNASFHVRRIEGYDWSAGGLG